MKMHSNRRSKISLSDIFVEFLEVAIHDLLFYRRIYPETIFSVKQKYGIPIHVSNFPDLNTYITESLKIIQQFISSNSLHHLAIVFMNNNRPIERFIFNVLKINAVISVDAILEGNDPYLIRLQESMRGFCLKLSVCDTSLKALPLDDSTTFQIIVYTTETAMVSLSKSASSQKFPWIEPDQNESEFKNGQIVPIKSINLEYLQVEMYFEQLAF